MSRFSNIRYSKVKRYSQFIYERVGVPRKITMKIMWEKGCFPTAEKRISKTAYTELRACLLIFDHVDRGVANVELLDNIVQNTIVTIIGYVIIVEKRIEWAS